MPAAAGTASASFPDGGGRPSIRYLGGRAAFDRLHRCGRRFRGRVLRAILCENTLGVTRLGFSVSSRLGGAVARNLFKRRVRQLIRELAPGPVDMVVGPARPVAEITWQSLAEDVRDLGEELRRQHGPQSV